jgi:hypothetical protein
VGAEIAARNTALPAEFPLHQGRERIMSNVLLITAVVASVYVILYVTFHGL